MRSRDNLSLPPHPFPCFPSLQSGYPGGEGWRAQSDKPWMSITEACTTSTCFQWMLFLTMTCWEIQTLLLLQGSDSRCSRYMVWASPEPAPTEALLHHNVHLLCTALPVVREGLNPATKWTGAEPFSFTVFRKTWSWWQDDFLSCFPWNYWRWGRGSMVCISESRGWNVPEPFFSEMRCKWLNTHLFLHLQNITRYWDLILLMHVKSFEDRTKKGDYKTETYKKRPITCPLLSGVSNSGMNMLCAKIP